MLPTIREVLQLPALAAGDPRVLAGADGLDHDVRWAHVAEVADVGELLRGDELVLTTGVALPRSDDGVARFVRTLADVPVAGLVVELGTAYVDRLPAAMVRAARAAALPLVELRRTVAFVEVTEAVHGRVIDAQLETLRRAQAMHDTFTELAVEGAEAGEVVRQAARMAGAPVVLETLGHQVVEHDAAGADEARLLARWQQRSRAVRVEGRAGVDPASGWVVAGVAARGEDWGRLVLVRPPGQALEPGRGGPQDVVLLERAATTLALNRLIARDREGLERQTHRTLLTALLDHAHPDAEVALRAAALGVPLAGRRLVGAVVRRADGAAGMVTITSQARLRDLADAVAAATRQAKLPALVGALDDRTIGVLAALDRRDHEAAVLDRLGAAVERAVTSRLPDVDPSRLLLAAGTVVAGLRDARRSVVEAGQVADAAAHLPRRPRFVRMHDVGVRGLLSLLRGDARVETFVERALGPLLALGDRRGAGLLATLRAYLDAGRNKSAAAAAMHLSRPAFYDRMGHLQDVLGADLDDVETCLALHLALLAHDAR